MKRLLNFTIIKLTFFLIAGITIGYFANISLKVSLYATATLLFALLLAFLKARKQLVKTIWFGLLTYILMILIGILTTQLHEQKNFSNHYSHLISKDIDSLKTVSFRIREVLKPGQYHDKYIIDILDIDGKNTTGKSLLNIKKDTLLSTLKVDAIYLGKVTFKDLIHPLNPYQFDYKNYLEKTYIYHQLFTTKKPLLQVSSHIHTLFGIASKIREHINKKLEVYNFKPDELAIINALLLGQRQDISKSIYNSYTNAGAIHILAVSGLHVGIILLILSLILKPLEQFKHGKLIKTILLISFLWAFALVAGLSASVTRAVTMFSIVAIAFNLRRPTNIYNTLAISMFIILLFKPMFLFDVGFQLSYLAVFAIVIVDPILYKLWHPKSKMVNLYWHTLTITISAQFGIIPISLYYFHQFPGLFFLSNLIIIPFLGIILGFGILIIFLAVFNILPTVLGNIYGWIIGVMNNFITWIAKQDAFLFKDIAFNLSFVLVFYLLIIATIRLLKKWNYNNLKLLLIAIIVCQCTVLYTKYSRPEHTFVIFHKSRHSLIGHTHKNKLITSHDFDSITQLKTHIIRDYCIGNHIKLVERDTFQPVYLLKDKILLVVDSLSTYNIKTFSPDYVLLRQSPKLNLNRLIDSIKPKYIIADGSNYKSYIAHWEAICKKRKLPFHQTSKKGAFIINY